MSFAVSSRIAYRDEMGSFISKVKAAGTATVEETIEEGARMSRDMAPIGHKPDPRTVPLRSSIFTKMLSSTQGVWFSVARHALPIEKGAVPHPIRGNPNLRFFWDKAGRMWIPGEDFYGIPGLIDHVNHPGNAADPFLRPAYDSVKRRVMRIAKKHYPG